MQHSHRGATFLKAYHAYLQSDHDFRVWADVLNMEEEYESSVDILDGQINIDVGADGPERTGSLVVSDPEGSLTYGNSYARDSDGVLWVNRLVRITHRVVMPTYGIVDTVALVGLPVGVARQGAEVTLELVDKSALADHGVRGRSYKKGAKVRDVIIDILRDRCGEHKFSIPATNKTTSQVWTIGMGEDSLTPWQVVKRIARKEMGWRAFYSSDGVATFEPPGANHKIEVEHVLSLPDASTSFTDFSNYAKVTSKRQLNNKKEAEALGKKKGTTMVFQGVAVLPPKHDLSEQALSRNGVPRTLPIVVEDNDLKGQEEVNTRTRQELRDNSGLESDNALEIMPFFHMDPGDIFVIPDIADMPLDTASIPLGVGGNMTLGKVKWVSRPVKVKKVKEKSWVVKKKKRKGGKKNKDGEK